MSRIRVFILIPIVLASILTIVPGTIPQAHAPTTGVVCITEAVNRACPLFIPTLTSGLPQTQLQVAIVVDSSAGLNGFDITLLADHTILKPAGYSITNTILPGNPSILAHCIGGVGGTNAGCASTDNADTLHIAGGTLGITTAPTTGLLFTAIYNVTGATFSTPIGFQTGCTQTSVSGGVCVTIPNGSTTPPPETALTAKYSNRQYFSLEPLAAPPALTLWQGDNDTTLSLNVTSVNNFAGTVALTTQVTTGGPSVTLQFNSLKIDTVTTSNFTRVTVIVPPATVPGTYILNVTGTSSGVPANTLLISLTVLTPDFTITADPVKVAFNVSIPRSVTVRLDSVGNFSGVVSLSISYKTPGLNASLQRSSLNLPYARTPPPSTSNSTLVSMNSTIAGAYDLNITATSGSLSRTFDLKVTVQDFTLTVPSTPLTVIQGQNNTEPVFLAPFSTQLYNVTVTLSRIYTAQQTSSGWIGPSTGISVSCKPISMTIFTNTSSEVPSPTTCTVIGYQLGNYTVTVTANVVTNGRPVNHAIMFQVFVVGPDFTISPTPSNSIQTVPVGGSSSVSVFLKPLRGLNSNVTIIANFVGDPTSAPTISVILPPLILKCVACAVLNSTYPNATATITITAGTFAPSATYILQVQANSNSGTHVIQFGIVVTTTSSAHDLAVPLVTPLTQSATVGSNVTATILVENLGKANETSTVYLIVGDISVAQTNVTLSPGQNMNITLTWKTTGYNPGTYLIGGKIAAVNGEFNKDNNIYRSPISVTLVSSNNNVFSQPFVLPAIIAAIVAIIIIGSAIFLQSRRKPKTQ